MRSAHLTEERLRLQAEAREFAHEHVSPLAARLDALHEDIPQGTLDAMAERGYFGITIPSEYGGLGLGVFEYCLISEELSRGWMSCASIIARANGTGTGVSDPDRRAELLRRSAQGNWLAGVAISEPGAGSDLSAISCAAELRDDTYVINGEKRWCGWALSADLILVLARVGLDRTKGLEWLIIDKKRGEFPAGVTGQPIPKIGYFGITSYALQLRDVVVPAANRLATHASDGGRGFQDAMKLLNVARVHTAARAVGAARGAYEDASAYARTRVQFGRPIADFQAIRFKLADMATEIEAARQLYHHAADLLDRGERCEEICSMAKLHSSEMAERVTSEAMQVLGGNGYTTEYAVERHWRDARVTKIFEGTSEIQRLIISKRLLESEG
jgi:alkylation response protein AidB-like acyl-CoA dehydrogenase